jgi:chondroitin AC lyase
VPKRILPLLLALLPFSAPASVDSVRQNFIDYYIAAGAPRTAARLAFALEGLEASARANTAPGFLLSDGSWSDINYKEIPSGSWSPWAHSQRLFVMAKAYRTPGQALHGDPQLRMQIESALAYVPVYYGKTTLPLGNWWFWTIGVPLDLGPTLVLMRGEVSQKVIDDCVSTLAFHIGSSPTSRGLVGPVPVGENLVWSSYTHLCLGLMRDDAAMLAAVREAMTTVCAPAAGDGLKIDRSFHQHGAQLYTGGYGGAFANDVAKYALFTRGSEFALPAASLRGFADYVADGIAWSLHGNYFDVSVVGREVARPSTTGYHGIAALLQASQFDSPRLPAIRAAAAAMLESWQWGLPPELAALAEQTFPAPAWPAGHQHYFMSDYTVHRRPGWFASIKMFSTRTKSGESTNNENVLGSRQSDGRFALTLDGSEYYARQAWPALDWTRLPGVTVEQSPTAANSAYGYGKRAFAGGTGNGRDGVSAMDVAPIGSALTAKKSWFFFDDVIVFLTNSITSPSANRVETVIQQWPLGSSPVVQQGGWTFCEGVGYYVYPQTAKLNVEQITRTGTWAALGGSTDTTPRTATFLTLWLDHGVGKGDGTTTHRRIRHIARNHGRAHHHGQRRERLRRPPRQGDGHRLLDRRLGGRLLVDDSGGDLRHADRPLRRRPHQRHRHVPDHPPRRREGDRPPQRRRDGARGAAARETSRGALNPHPSLRDRSRTSSDVNPYSGGVGTPRIDR